jgi:hypothetical protein
MNRPVIPLYSFLLGLYPILNLYARNLVFVPLAYSLRPAALTLGLLLFFLIGFRLVLRSWPKAGLLCSLLVVLFYSFGHVANALEQWAWPRQLPFDVSWLGWTWLLLFGLFSLWVVRARLPDVLGSGLNVAAILLVAFPLVTIASSFGANSRTSPSDQRELTELRGEQEAESGAPPRSSDELPDIYYLIFDAYSRADKLQEFYGYDNSAFIDALQRRGFFVAGESRSNYLSTTYSLNTSTNLIYIGDYPTRIFRKVRYNLWTNHVSEFLRGRGYQVVVFDSGTGDSNFQYADVFLSPQPADSQDQGVVNAFEQLLLRTTMAQLLIRGGGLGSQADRTRDLVSASVDRELDLRRERIRFALEHVPDYASRPGHFFVFAHIYLPHIPFLYGSAAQPLRYHENLNLYWYEVEPENYIEYYGYQLDYLNRAILNTVDEILARTQKPAVIVLQADHGDEKYLKWEAPTPQGVDVRSGIFNAIYYSDGATGALYPSLTPVNTFRLILNHWFGTRYPLLPDRVYFHEHPLSTPVGGKPEFIEACAVFGVCLPDFSG